MSLRREGLFLYKIIGMQMHETNTTMSTMYPTFVSVIAEFTDKLNLTYLYIYIIILCCFVEVIEETNLGLHRQMQRVEIPGSKVVEWSSKGCRIAPTINWFIPLWSLRNLKNQDESG